jgi:peptidoglycan/xylan/chitin deacetylase (PgdA/CDA1 family)
MTVWRERAIDAGMQFFRASGAHRLAAPFTRGLGAILAFHRVRPDPGAAFAPNAGLEITPEFLDAALTRLRARGYEFLTLDAAIERLRRPGPSARPFLALTFDDGYRDLVDYALPALKRHRAPFTAFVTPGFADGAARLWWLELEEAVNRLAFVDIVIAGRRIARDCATVEGKREVFACIYRAIRAQPEPVLLAATAALSAQARVDARALTQSACLDWSGLATLADCPLAEIGAHSLTHPRLATLGAAEARYEMAESRARLVARLGAGVRHFCYPVGDPTSAGRREFALAAELGFESAVTTRPGVVFEAHRAHLHALPRLSVNGRHQRLDDLDILLSGAPFALVNRGRRVAA